MIDLLQKIVDLFVCWVETGVMTVVNLIIVGVASAVSVVLALLPNMPSSPTIPSDIANALSAADYYVPLTFGLTLAGTTFLLILAIWLVKIPLRWVKAAGGE